MSDILGYGERTARKDHVCAYCGLTIVKGSSYHWWKGIDAGRFWIGHAHTECQLALWWDNGYWGDEDLPDPGEFRTDVLARYRDHMRLAANDA